MGSFSYFFFIFTVYNRYKKLITDITFMKIRRFLLLFYLVFYSLFSFSQLQCNFENYSREQGLSDNFIYSISQDSNKYIWMATSFGINKFDGIQFQHYVKSDNLNKSVLRNDFMCSYIDLKGRLWFGSHNGTVMRYDNSKDTFENLSFDFSYVNEYPSIVKFYQIRNSPVYALTTHGLFVFEESTKKFKFLFKSIQSLHSSHIISMFIDNLGNFWIGTAKGELIKIDKIGTKHQTILMKDEIGILRVSTFLKINDSLYYVGTSRGVYELNTQTAICKKSTLFTEINQNYISAIIRDKTNNIWFGTNYNGLWVCDNTKRFYHIEEFETQGVKIASINDIFCDSYNSIWVATQGNGLFMHNPAKNKVHHTTMEIGLAHSVVSAITEDSQGNVWVGTDGGGISIFNSNFNFLHELQAPFELSSNSILGFAKRTPDEVWVCTWGGGLIQINMKNYSTKKYVFSQTDATNNLIKSLCFQDSLTLWVGTYGNGVKEFDITTGKFINKTRGLDTVFIKDKQQFINQILRDKFGNMWVATLRNVYKITKNSCKLIVTYDVDKNSYFPGYIHTIATDNNGNILIGTNKGVLLYSNQGTFITDISKNLPNIKNAENLSIRVDSNNRYWIASTNGMYMYNPSNKTYQLFFVDNYAKGNFYTPRATYMDSKGRLHWGTMNGLYSFFPEKIGEKQRISNLLFSNLFISYQKIEPNSDFYPSHISQLQSLVLTHNQNIWGVSFDAICYNAPDAVEFAYKLQGFDKNWNYIGNKREITFTNIPPGEYTLLVKSWINNPNDNKQIELQITILPPWWKTIWFTVLVIGLIVLALYGFYYYRVYSLKKQKQKLVEEVAKQTKTLSEQKFFIEEQNVELKQVNDTKNYLFTIVSHDLRNSFTSLHGFSELLDDEYEKISEKQKKEYVTLIKESSTIIYNLLENLLSWSRSQTSSIICNPENYDIKEVVDYVIDLYSHMAKEKKIKVLNTIPIHTNLYFDKDMIITVFRNIYNNALKFTPNGGEITFSITHLNSKVEVIISDTGAGMDADQLDRLFTIGSQSKQKRTKLQGSGLGLIVCKEFVEKNQGEIYVTSEVGVGSQFHICLPGDNH